MHRDEPIGMELKNLVRAKHIANLLLQNKNYTEIAKELNISRPTLYAILDKQYVKDTILVEIEKAWGKTRLMYKKPSLYKRQKTINRINRPRLINVSKQIRVRNAELKRKNKTRYERIYDQKTRQKIHEFDLTLDYLLELAEHQNHRCALTGVKFYDGLILGDKHKKALQASLDRIDSDKGYIEGNIQWVAMWANTAKLHYSMEFFNEMCKHVAEQHP